MVSMIRNRKQDKLTEEEENMLKNQKGFTLIEIIAVLVILGILAAVAAPKYLDLAEQARIMAAQGAIAEIKGRLSSAQAKYMMTHNGTAPNAEVLVPLAAGAGYYGDATNLVNVGSDFVVATLVGTSPIIQISVTSMQGTTFSPAVNGTFSTATGL